MFDKTQFEKTVENNVAMLKYTDKDAFLKNTDIPEKTFKDVHDYKQEYLTEATKTIAQEAEDIMKKDKNITKVIGEVPFSHLERGNATITVDREKTFTDRFSNEGGEPTEIKKSTVSLLVKDPAHKVTKSVISELQNKLTDTLLGK